MSAALEALRDVVQEDAGGRGLRSDPAENLISACAGDFAAACRSIAATAQPRLAVVTGFYIPHAPQPCGETDGPLGAVFLARALRPLGIDVVLLTDPFACRALEVGVEAAGLSGQVPGLWLAADGDLPLVEPFTHLIALERVGPSHTPESVWNQPASTPEQVERFLREVPPDHYDRCHTMRGQDITALMRPAHRLFEDRQGNEPVTIGIGDGGNEIGMGKIAWDIIRRNIPGGGLIACRVPTDQLIVAGVSNWGAYALAAGVWLLRAAPLDPDLFDPQREESILRRMVEEGPLVDGKTGRQEATVDGLPFARHAEVLTRLGRIVAERGPFEEGRL